METSQELILQVVLYLGILAFYATAVVRMVRGRSRAEQWTAFCLALFFLENVVTYPAALAGYTSYAWLLGNPVTTFYLFVVLVGIATAMTAAWAYTRFTAIPRILDDLPPLRMNEALVLRVAYGLSCTAAVASIVLSGVGLHGYFMEERFLYEVPTWLSIMRTLVNVCLGLSFIVFLSAYAKDGRENATGWLLACLWSIAGIASAFKMYVIMPFAFIALAAWLTRRRLRVVHVAVLIGAVFLAYGIVEPMRQLRWETNYTALESLAAVLSDRGYTAADTTPVLERVMQRIDFTATAVEALEADRDGRLPRYRARLEEAYGLIPLLAYIPAALWPDKPLADLGRELSIALSGIETNSITPSHVVASYLWLGIPGVILNSLVCTYFFVLGARLLERYGGQRMVYVPVIFLVLVFTAPGSIMAFHYVTIIRALTLFGLFYAAAYSLDLATRPNVPTAKGHLASRTRR